MKHFIILLSALFCVSVTFGQDTIWATTQTSPKMMTYEYAVKDTNHLLMDVYYPQKQNDEHACIIFAFGGGFVNGSRDDGQVKSVKDYYTQKGYVVIAIDYRLGLRDTKKFSIASGVKKFQNAIDMAASDLLSSVDFILNNLLVTDEFIINPDNIILMGSSAGAITILQSDYAICNRLPYASMIPLDFHFAGVMPFSGGIFSNKGKVKYKYCSPAPTLFYHGTVDKLVPYNKIQFMNLGFFGSKSLVKRFEKFDFPYHIRRYENAGHEVAAAYPYEFAVMDEFISDFVFGKRQYQIDELFNNPYLPATSFSHLRVRDLKKLNQ